MPQPADPAALLAQQLPLVDEVARSVARRKHARADEVDEFVACSRLRMVEDDYAVLRRFEWRSSLRTYLTAVLQRLFLDERIRRWGRWRHSAAARRLGPLAQRIEILLSRDGHSREESWEILTANEGWAVSRAEFDEIVAALPVRSSHRLVDESELESVSVPGQPAESVVQAREHLEQQARTHGVLGRALRSLTAEERLILKLRFQDGLTVGAVARALALPDKPLYRRMERLLARLRAALEKDGLEAGGLDGVLGEDAPYPDYEAAEASNALDWAF